MLRLTCHQPCRETSAHAEEHINKHLPRVPRVPHPTPPSIQGASAEVTRQVAANKALRGQLQEKEDKLCQLQDKCVSHVSPLFLLFSSCSAVLSSLFRLYLSTPPPPLSVSLSVALQHTGCSSDLQCLIPPCGSTPCAAHASALSRSLVK